MTDGKPIDHCRGNACVLFLDFGERIVFDNWGPEGSCECWTPKVEREKS